MFFSLFFWAGGSEGIVARHPSETWCFNVSMLLALQAGAIIAGHSMEFCEERCEVFWSDDSLDIE